MSYMSKEYLCLKGVDFSKMGQGWGNYTYFFKLPKKNHQEALGKLISKVISTYTQQLLPEWYTNRKSFTRFSSGIFFSDLFAVLTLLKEIDLEWAEEIISKNITALEAQYEKDSTYSLDNEHFMLYNYDQKIFDRTGEKVVVPYLDIKHKTFFTTYCKALLIILNNLQSISTYNCSFSFLDEMKELEIIKDNLHKKSFNI